MSGSVTTKTTCNYCRQAVSNQIFLTNVETDNPTDFFDWKITIVFYSGLHYMKSFANAKGVDLKSHNDFNEKTVSQGSGLSPELIIDGNIRRDYINLRNLSYNARYDGYFSEKIDKILIKGRLKDSKVYLSNVKSWIIPKLESENIEVNYTF